MTRPSLAALEVFLAVARHGSFRAAAAERGVGASALSHVIRGLETSLDVRLFNRTTRSVSLTETGRQLVERVRPALGDLADALDGVATLRGHATGLLRLNVPRIANELIVAPVVERFLAAHPAVRLEVVSFDGLVDIVSEGFDAGIRRDRRLAPGMIALPVGPPRRFAIVGSPAYFAGRERPRVPHDLRAHDCIERGFPSGARYGWEFSRGDETIEMDVTGRLIVDDTGLMLQAARDGIGLACVFESLVEEAIATGALLRVLDEWCPLQPRFFLYYPGRRHVRSALRAFVEMIR